LQQEKWLKRLQEGTEDFTGMILKSGQKVLNEFKDS
jgi:hypothetical protein